MPSPQRICVYCASSELAPPQYAAAAGRLGKLLAEAGATIVYGGGALGSMKALADEALTAGGRVIGVLPRFMYDIEWGHHGLTELILVADLHERKRLMVDGVDAIVALPGGSGTFEELMEAITWKRLGLYVNPIVIVNQDGYFDPLLEMFRRAVDHRFMDARHLDMWTAVTDVAGVLEAIRTAPPWDESARNFAALI
jgi:uncharacterized protein (TIGR00730 family)